MPLGHQCHGNETKQIVACLGILIKTNVDAEKVSREVTLQESRLADFLREKKHRQELDVLQRQTSMQGT